jgi:GNAT superfamily N-acetyltransferase
VNTYARPVDERIAVAARELTLQSLNSDVAVLAGVACRRLRGIDEPWASHARCTTLPSRASLDQALSWLRERAEQWTVVVPGELAGDEVFAGLEPWLTLPVMIRRESLPAAMVPGLTIRPAANPAEFLSVYGEMLAPLVTPDHLADPGQRYLVAEEDGRVVGCAIARCLGDTSYVNGVTVLPDARGHGIGTAISAAAADAFGTDLVWLEALATAQPVYRRLGFEVIGEHVLLAAT